MFDDDYVDHLKSASQSFTKFQRIREVTIDEENVMSCSCNYHKRWLMPCVHICCVLEKTEYYTSELFHLRWWKHFQYLYKKAHHISINKQD